MTDTGCSFLCVMLLSEALVKQSWWWWNLWVLACSQKKFIFPSFMKLSLAGYEILGWKFFSLRILNIDPHSLLVCRVSAARSAVSLIGFPLWVTWPFSLAALRIFSFISTLVNLWLCVLGLLYFRNIFVVFSVLPGVENCPALLGEGNFPGWCPEEYFPAWIHSLRPLLVHLSNIG